MKFITQLFFKTKASYFIVRFVARINEAFRYRRSLYERSIAKENLEVFFSSQTVQAGIMKGLKYPSLASFGSSLFPKLAGTYENELNASFKKLLLNNYHTIIDVGSAEGYYAVGLARLFPKTHVIAFDIDPKAREMCEAMARINHINNITILDKCTSKWFQKINPQERMFIVCDCEGYERYLFDALNIDRFKNVDFIIELHPMVEKGVEQYLYDLFVSSHHISFVSSKDNNRKIFDLDNQYDTFSELHKLMIVEEGRPFTMDWLIATAKSTLEK